MRPPQVAAAAGIVAIVCGGIGFLAGRTIESPADAAARARAPKASLVAVPVKEQQLAASLVVRGQISAQNATEITRAASTIGSTDSIVVFAPAKGAEVNEGDVILEVGNRPLIALMGDLPMYRDLRPGTVGQDVALLEHALDRLGIDPGTIDENYDSDTADAVGRLYERAGFSAIGRTAEEQSKIDQLSAQAATARAANDSATANKAENELDQVLATTGKSVPANEVVFVKQLPAIVQSTPLERGSKIEGAIMTLASSGANIVASVARADLPLVKVGTVGKVEVSELNQTFEASVESIAAEPGTNGAGRNRHSITLSSDAIPTDALGASVRISIPVKSTEGKVLVVPAAALVLNEDGQAAVSVIEDEESNKTRTVDVTVGLRTRGLVEVKPTGGSLKAGEMVVVSEQAKSNDEG